MHVQSNNEDFHNFRYQTNHTRKTKDTIKKTKNKDTKMKKKIKIKKKSKTNKEYKIKTLPVPRFPYGDIHGY